jgi:PLAT/LH2 domain
MDPDQYRITITTAVVEDGGTDEEIYIHLKGPQGQFSEKLHNPGRNDFEQGQTDTFNISGPSVSPIQSIGLRLERVTNDGNWPWRCKSVEVKNLTTGYSARIDDFGWVTPPSSIMWKSSS